MYVVDEILDSAKDEILKGGQITPTFFVISDSEVLVVDDEDFCGDETFSELKQLIKRNKAGLVLYVTETCFKREKESIIITDHLQKGGKVGLMLTAITPITEYTRIFPFERSKGKAQFESSEIEISEEVTGYGDVIFEHTTH